jgi:signal transduction histidine kinase
MLNTVENPDKKMLKIMTTAKNMAEKADKTKSDFLSIASHQLRTPLTSIRGYSSMLLEGDFDPLTKSQEGAVSEIHTGSERMAYLIDDLLNVSRLQSGRFVINKTRCNLSEMVYSEIEQASIVADSHKITVKFNDKNWSALPEVDIDRGKIGEVLSNIIDNAIFYSQPDSAIEISLTQEGKFIEFRVKDSGIGVPKDEQGDLFTKFYRASNARTKRPDGTGIGLFLAKKIINSHDGKIIFESREGKGSVFGFRLPIVDGDK